MSESYVIVKKVHSSPVWRDEKRTLYWTGGRRGWVWAKEKAHIYRSKELASLALQRLHDIYAEVRPFSGA